MLAIVCWAAKPTTSPSTAVEARIPVASRFSSVNWASASATTTRKTTSRIRRRRMRSRVLVELETCETAGDMEVKLNGSVESGEVEAPGSRFPYATWGPWAAVLGVPVALVAGAILGLPALIADNPGPGEELGTAASAV